MLAAAGANPVVLDAELDRAKKVAAEVTAIGRKTAALSADVTQEAEVQRAVAAAAEAVGGLDLVVNIVGSASWSPLLEVDEETWERDFDVNLKHHLYVGRSAAKHWIASERPGALCVVASVSGRFSSAGHGAYGAAKAGVMNFVQTAAQEWWPHGIRVNAVAPGAVRTPRIEASWENGTIPRPTEDLMGRLALPEDIAGAITFLVSDLSAKITGQTVIVDGGWTTRFPWELS